MSETAEDILDQLFGTGRRTSHSPVLADNVAAYIKRMDEYDPFLREARTIDQAAWVCARIFKSWSELSMDGRMHLLMKVEAIVKIVRGVA